MATPASVIENLLPDGVGSRRVIVTAGAGDAWTAIAQRTFPYD